MNRPTRALIWLSLGALAAKIHTRIYSPADGDLMTNPEWAAHLIAQHKAHQRARVEQRANKWLADTGDELFREWSREFVHDQEADQLGDTP